MSDLRGFHSYATPWPWHLTVEQVAQVREILRLPPDPHTT